jgi:hypothetical protein
MTLRTTEFRHFVYRRNSKYYKTHQEWRLLGMLRRVALLRSDVSEERSVSIIRVTRIGELGTTLAVTSN